MPTAPGNIKDPARILRFFSITAVFDIDKQLIRDKFGREAGWLSVPVVPNEARMKGFRGKYEILLLSEEMGPDRYPIWMLMDDLERENLSGAQEPSTLRTSTYEDRNDPKLPGNWNCYNILVIVWEGEVAYRVAIGWIYQQSLEHSFSLQPEGKLINLG